MPQIGDRVIPERSGEADLSPNSKLAKLPLVAVQEAKLVRGFELTSLALSGERLRQMASS